MLDWKNVAAELKNRLDGYERRTDIRGAGVVLSAGDGVVQLDGLGGCKLNELLEFDSGAYAIVMNLEEDRVGAVLLGNDAQAAVGMRAYGTGQVLSVPVGKELLGRVVSPLGQPLDNLGRVHTQSLRPLESPAPGILDRKPVSKPMETGLMAIDAMVPIGRGQRELIIGDRQTGKTSVAVDTILNQAGKNIACVYVAIGQKASSVAQIIEKLRGAGAMEYTIIVCATASDSATMQYIAPYAGCAMAEWFMENGRDALVVYDDLTKHAVSYRAMSLLLRRPPGREAYPGDVFYLHSRLLERAARVSEEYVEKFTNGEVKGKTGSLTALPIIETQAGDVSAFVPTNVISITDGQIFLETDLFNAGIRPAVNAGISVSRVGGAAQTKIIKKLSGGIRIALAQYRELAAFAQFASDLDEATRKQLERGQRVTELMKQKQYAPMSIAEQALSIYAVNEGYLDDVPVAKILAFEAGLHAHFANTAGELIDQINTSGNWNDDIEAAFKKGIEEFKATGSF